MNRKKSPKFQFRNCNKKRVQTMIRKKSPKFQVRNCHQKRVQTMIRKKSPKFQHYRARKYNATLWIIAILRAQILIPVKTLNSYSS